MTSAQHEVEIKFLVHDAALLESRLRDLGFRQKTPPTHELNTLYDSDGLPLRRRGEVLRIRKYGDQWKLTHKSKGTSGKHKTRLEQETAVADGRTLDGIFRALGFSPSFVYEKFRSEWTDGHGEVVVDRTPIGNLAEIEGTPEWIDATAARLAIRESEFITKSYAELFNDWKARTGSAAQNMTYEECRTAPPIL